MRFCFNRIYSIWKCDFRALFVKSTDLGGGTPLWSDQAKTQNQWQSGDISSFSHLIWFFSLIEYIFFKCMIVTQSLLDLKTLFLWFLVIFDAILKFRLSKFSKIWKFQILLGHFKRGYLLPVPWISRKEPGNRIFRSSRCGLKKLWSKNIIFSQSYDLLETDFFSWSAFSFYLENHFIASREDSHVC